MIRLATVIDAFEADFLTQYRNRLRPEHLRALAAMKGDGRHERWVERWWMSAAEAAE